MTMPVDPLNPPPAIPPTMRAIIQDGGGGWAETSQRRRNVSTPRDWPLPGLKKNTDCGASAPDWPAQTLPFPPNATFLKRSWKFCVCIARFSSIKKKVSTIIGATGRRFAGERTY
jgi:hypothetical protein